MVNEQLLKLVDGFKALKADFDMIFDVNHDSSVEELKYGLMFMEIFGVDIELSFINPKKLNIQDHRITGLDKLQEL